jgi:hypothetical protein
MKNTGAFTYPYSALVTGTWLLVVTPSGRVFLRDEHPEGVQLRVTSYLLPVCPTPLTGHLYLLTGPTGSVTVQSR